MQVYTDTAFPYHPASPYKMANSHLQNSPSAHYSQHPQYPYNPYPHLDRHSRGPSYTLRDASVSASTAETTPAGKTLLFSPCVPSNEYPLAPPQDMLSTLERLLMDISPFPPSIPKLAQPTCPPLEDQTMTETFSSLSSSSSASFSSEEPFERQTEPSFNALEQYYGKQESNSQQKEPLQPHRRQPTQHSTNGLLRSASPTTSAYSYDSSSSPSHSKNVATEMNQELPYWSPSTPSLQIDQSWSNQSSPVVSSQQLPSSSWGYPHFEQMSLPLTMRSLGETSTAHFDSQGNNRTLQQLEQQPQQLQGPSSHSHSQSTLNNNNTHSNNSSAGLTCPSDITRRAARTPPRRRASSDLFGIRSYESPTNYFHHHHRHPTQSSSMSTSNSQSNASFGADTGITSTSDSTSSATVIARKGVRSYPCPTCSKPFPTRTQLKSHMAIHVDDFPFPCLYSGCDLHFKRKHDLRRHVDAKHALVKKYLCSGGCGEGFGRRDQMVRHMGRGACGKNL